MLYQNVSVQPQFISAESDQDLLSNLDFVQIAPEEQQEAEVISVQMQLVREGNKAAIAAVISPKVRILTHKKTTSEFSDYLNELDIEVINFNMAMKP